MPVYTFPLENKHFSDFSPCDFGYQNCNLSHNFGPAIRNYYLIHYIESGKGVFKNDRGEYSLKGGDAFLIRPGEVTTYTADSKNPWSYIWIGFTGNMSSHFDEISDVFRPDGNIFTETKTYSDSLIEERLVSTLFRLYCNLFEDSASPDYVNKVIGFIKSRYMEEIRIEEIAHSLNLNRKYLSRIFKAKTGITMQEYLINKRLTEAQKLLEKGYNVGEAATLCGYTDTFAFSKAFKSRFGKPPKAYKKTDNA